MQIVVFVPLLNKEELKQGMFTAGAGSIGNYEQCCFEHEGTGQFKPLKGSHAFIGSIGTVERVKEVRIEMSCRDEIIEGVIRALKENHPYETPAYYVIKILDN